MFHNFFYSKRDMYGITISEKYDKDILDVANIFKW